MKEVPETKERIPFWKKERQWRRQLASTIKALELEGENSQYAAHLPGLIKTFKGRPPVDQINEMWDFTKAAISTFKKETGARKRIRQQTQVSSNTAVGVIPQPTAHIALMLHASEHFRNIALIEKRPSNWFPKKEQLMNFFLQATLPGGQKISKSQASMMATFSRPPEAMVGGNKRSNPK